MTNDFQALLLGQLYGSNERQLAGIT